MNLLNAPHTLVSRDGIATPISTELATTIPAHDGERIGVRLDGIQEPIPFGLITETVKL